MTEALDRYMSPEVTDYLVGHHQFYLDGDVKDLVTLALRIHNYDRLVENLTPWELAYMLNNKCYLRLVSTILDQWGRIDNFHDGGLLATYGAPFPTKNGALSAVKAALQIQKDCMIINKELTDEGKPPLKVGVGLAAGLVYIGNIGSPQKVEYTVLGKPVTHAKRLASLTEDLHEGILLDESVYGRVSGVVAANTRLLTYGERRFRAYVVYGLIGLQT